MRDVPQEIDISIFDNMTINTLEAKRIKTERENETDPLVMSLKQSTHINENKKKQLINLAEKYLEDIRDNLLKDQFDLESKYQGTTIDDWSDFLSDRIVSTYIKKHKNTLLRVSAERNLSDPYAKNKRDNLTLIKNLKEEEKQDKELVVIMRLPDKYEGDCINETKI